ncbi:MAG: hypothetical protein M5R36_09580 [Deltaproteobacteria bacterium]|nr:hypothetical protein [Deltaproteobacteria bacterium]
MQIWGEYSVIFPLIAAWVLDHCEPREPRRVGDRVLAYREKLLGPE